jgi:hypothetical protein
MDIEGVGEAVYSLPILANCKVPDIELARKEITLPSCYIRYPYYEEIELLNEFGETDANFYIVF